MGLGGGDAPGLLDSLGDGLGVLDAVELVEGSPVLLGVRVGDRDSEGAALPLAVALWEGVVLGEVDGLSLVEVVPDTDGVSVEVALSLSLTLVLELEVSLGLALSLGLTLPLREGDTLVVGVTDADAPRLRDAVGVSVTLGVTDCVKDFVAESEWLLVCDTEDETDAVGVCVEEGVPLSLPLALLLRVEDGVCEVDGVTLEDGVDVTLTEPVVEAV